jgi:hypothetical protein
LLGAWEEFTAEGGFVKQFGAEGTENGKLKEEVAARREQEEAAAALTSSGGVSLEETAIAVQSNGTALVKLDCVGIESCHGKLMLTAKVAAKAKGKMKPTHAAATTIAIGTESFSIAGDETETVKVSLNATGRALLATHRGRLDASLAIFEFVPGSQSTQTRTVRLMRAKANKAKS